MDGRSEIGPRSGDRTVGHNVFCSATDTTEAERHPLRPEIWGVERVNKMQFFTRDARHLFLIHAVMKAALLDVTLKSGSDGHGVTDLELDTQSAS